MENFILTFSFLLIGMGLRRIPQFPENSAQALNLFVIYVSLPALVLLKIPGLVFSSKLMVPILMPWLMLAATAAIILLLARLLGWRKEIVGALLLLVPLGNTSFLGIPMVKAFFGEQGIPFAVLYDQLGSFLALATYGSVVLAVYGHQGAGPSAAPIIKRIATFPPFIALLIAFVVLRRFSLPDVAQVLLGDLAATLVPVVMIAVGFQISFRLKAEVVKPLVVGLVVKLCVAPLLALLFCRFFELDSLAARVAVFEAGMPPMVSAGAMAIIAGLSPELTAALVGGGIILSFVTLPILFQFF
ncbi:MAG: AEC family transporter [Desulfobulbaceae bacterium]|nr:AEC family transporter [Desulfobulbaceae bacterium]HIJ78949.1 AEC family transporter [Deltaproteobacteria bacterium]